ncbi:MAG TPA: enoyl-CoA hydratase [Thermoanaerobaculia bacterium]|jgi:enoyl-CoA hydratase/carnithine racemase|nr:enoyl-CoA hydratase [Thermoanaerobaculia bacterium]
MNDEVLLERPDDRIAVIRLNRPSARNALSVNVRETLARHFTELSDDQSTRAIILTGGDTIFAAGADLRDMVDRTPIDLMMRRSERLWQAIADCPKPVIAAINGYALGGGCELAMHCDIIVAGEGAQFGQPEIKVGIMPGAGGTQRLVRAVGKFRAMKILMTGEPFPARDALAMGLVSEVVPDAEVFGRGLAIAKTIAAMPPLAILQIKEAVLAGEDSSLQAGLMLERKAFQLLFASADQKEGMRAFLEKRKPEFEGK